MSKFWRSSGSSGSSSSSSSEESDVGADSAAASGEWSEASRSAPATAPASSEMEDGQVGDPRGLLSSDLLSSRRQREEQIDDADAKEDEASDQTDAWRRIKSSQVFAAVPKSTKVKPSDCTRLVCISDTHGKHNDVILPPGDILLHAGDFTKSGEVGTMRDLNRYFEASGFDEVVCIAGNHDMTLHPEFYETNWRRFHTKKFDTQAASVALTSCTYLRDEECTSGGLRMHGTPWSPEFFNWAFNLTRGPEIRKLWQAIPDRADVLLVHGPPLGRGDITTSGVRAGCLDLLEEIQDRIQPRLTVFGHIHEGAGVSFDGTTIYANASSLDRKYRTSHFPIVIDVPHDTSKPAMLVEPECTLTFDDFINWLQRRGHGNLVEHCGVLGSGDGASKQYAQDKSRITGNALFESENFFTTCSLLGIHHLGKQGSQQLHGAVAELYAESF
uniref:Calcineurin-like phosphoesterase domain-containing protein n=1 Tax=Craspedostauros australis TaxID=1486917 RepID=A0A7R9ZRK8_9STRA|mmetsp:Transcript_7239/g.19620  ORF Transcript_7239/g.19620 Transcript_7239/m.19620 type:complete len:443 (+) Transcript_7239:3-1331(+)